MRVGGMRYKIEIQDFMEVKDKDGFVSREWKTEIETWADIIPVSAKEFMSAREELQNVTSKIYIRYREHIRSTMQIKYGERIFKIESVLPDRRRGLITILASEVE